MQSIQPLSVQPLAPHTVRTPSGFPAGPTGGPSFEDMLRNSIQQLNSTPQQTPSAGGNLTTQVAANPAQVLATIEHANSAIKTAMEVGNRIAAAYDEIKDLRM
jgi:flagellar hook-basal body complex protein FliE